MKNKVRKDEKSFFWGIREKISLTYIILMILLTGFIDFAVYQIYKQDIEIKEMDSMGDRTEILAENIKNLISGIESNLMSEIGRCNVFAYLDGDDETMRGTVDRKLCGLATLMHFRGLECEGIFLYAGDDKAFFCDYRKTGETFASFQKKQVFRTIQEKKEALFPVRGSTVWKSFQDEGDAVYIIKSYVDPATLEYEGIICLVLTKDELEKLLGRHIFGNIIYDQDGELLYCSRELDCKNLDSKKYLKTEAQILRRRGNWTLESVIAKAEVFRALGMLLCMLIVTEFFMMLAMIGIVYLVSSGFMWNVRELTRSIKQIQEGDSLIELRPRANDETTYLCEQFTSMYYRLQENTKQMILNESLLKKAEYSALQAQINPHFLYNSLESISAMAKISGQDEIVETVQMLSRLLRAALSEGQQEIPLRQELNYTENFLQLQHIITGGRLSWDIAVESELLDCTVPKLILQPIVENSVIHGLDDLLSDAVIAITADAKDDTLILIVSDNGKGADPAAVEKLLNQEDMEELQERGHIGIRSTQKRLQLLYGAQYGIEIECAPEDGMTTKFRLPLRRGS